VPLERSGIAQGRHARSQIDPVARSTTEGHGLLQHRDGVLQVPFGEVQVAEAVVDNHKQHGDLLVFAFQGATGGEDFLREI
jgi:hypothetical protein